MRNRPLIPPPKILPFSRKGKVVSLLLAAEALHKCGDIFKAMRAYRVIAELVPRRDPIMLRAMFLAALGAYQLRQYGDACQLMEAVRSAEWENPDVHYNLGLIYDASGNPEFAADSYRTALAIKPESAATETNLGNVLRQLGDEAGAELCYQRVLDRAPADPEARYNLAHVLLVRGELARGFQEFEQRWGCEGYVAEYGRPDLRAPRWTPDSPAKTVLVHAEQGFGDTLQFLRYLPMLLDRGLTVIFEAQPQLRRLLAQLEQPGLTLISRGDPVPDHDAQIPLLSLTAALQTGYLSIPPLLPLRAGPSSIDLGDSGYFRVGVCWSGNPNHHNDRNRSARLDALASMFHVAGIRWISLQVGAGAGDFSIALPQLMHWDGRQIVNELADVSAHLRDFADTAALIDQLDLVITVDTSIAHLAATLNKPVWLMLPHLPEWRWQQERADSPWYPSMRIFRQRARADWPGVGEQIRCELEAA